MSDGTVLNPGTSGDEILTEDTFTDTRTGVSGIKVATSKLRIGPNGVDGGSVVPEVNDLPVHDTFVGRLLEAFVTPILDFLPTALDTANKLMSGEIQVFSRSKVASVTQFGYTTTAKTILTPNQSRKITMVVNDTNVATAGNLYLLFVPEGIPAPSSMPQVSTSLYTVRIVPGGYYEFPQPVWPGRVDAIWDGTAGNAIITELS